MSFVQISMQVKQSSVRFAIVPVRDGLASPIHQRRLSALGSTRASISLSIPSRVSDLSSTGIFRLIPVFFILSFISSSVILDAGWLHNKLKYSPIRTPVHSPVIHAHVSTVPV